MAISEATKAQLIAGFYKLLPYVSGALTARGVITADQGTAIVNGAPEFMSYVLILAGVLGGIWTAVWSWWANRKANRIAVVAAMPEANVKVTDPALAAKVDQLTPATTPTVAP